MTQDNKLLPTEKNIEDYELLNEMLSSLAHELRELSKKKQEGVLNLTKVKMVNRVLKPLKEEILKNEPSQNFLDLLNEEDIPNNSDAVLIISQYETALKEYNNKYYVKDPRNRYSHIWNTQENPVSELHEEYEDDDEYEE